MEDLNLFLDESFQEPVRGDILLSEPFLPDPTFERTVILICDHTEEGSIGLILNRPTSFQFDQFIKDVPGFVEPLFYGGPVQQTTLHYIHKKKQILDGAIDIGNGLFWGGNFEQLISLIKTDHVNKKDFRFFLGYSGWGKNQLMEEIKQKSWIVYKSPSSETIFELSSESLWKEILKAMGGKYKVMSNYPPDPRLN